MWLGRAAAKSADRWRILRLSNHLWIRARFAGAHSLTNAVSKRCAVSSVTASVQVLAGLASHTAKRSRSWARVVARECQFAALGCARGASELPRRLLLPASERLTAYARGEGPPRAIVEVLLKARRSRAGSRRSIRACGTLATDERGRH